MCLNKVISLGFFLVFFLGVQYIFIEIQEYIQLYNTIQYIIHNIQKKSNIYIVAIRYLYMIIAMRQKYPTIKRKRFSLFVY